MHPFSKQLTLGEPIPASQAVGRDIFGPLGEKYFQGKALSAGDLSRAQIHA